MALPPPIVPAPGRWPALLFDLGGVLLNIDYERPVAAFRALAGGAGTELAFQQRAQAPLFDAYETGRLTDADFRAGLRALYPALSHTADDELDAAWNAILLDLPVARVALLRELRQAGYRLLLLSNTNALHRAAFDTIIRRAHDLPDSLAALFDQVYYSHEIGHRKPDASAFQFVLADQGLAPEQVLFIDDSPQHIAAARALGLTAIWLAPGQSVEDPLTSPLLHALAQPSASITT